jgi:predicted GNAT family N-acyltransferase
MRQDVITGVKAVTNQNETKQLYPQVRLAPETRETLEIVKEVKGWTGTEALKRIVSGYANRDRQIRRRLMDQSVQGA